MLASKLLWLKHLFKGLEVNVKTSMIYSDNFFAIHSIRSQIINERFKHIDINFQFIKEYVNSLLESHTSFTSYKTLTSDLI